MLKIGIAGLGFMGKMHYGVYSANPKAKVVAISDSDPKKLKGDWSAIAGNIGDASSKKVNLKGIRVYDRTEDLIRDPGVDVVDITLPTYLHAKYAGMALKLGKNVLCEKPMAMNPAECSRMLAAASSSEGVLMIGHCIRFWPE